MANFNGATYDVIAKSWKGEVVFTAETEKGSSWIVRNWGAPEFVVHSLENAASHVRRMNSDGVAVVLLCGV